MKMREKKLIVVGLVCLLLACFSNSVYALDFADLEGAVIVANDGQFLGKITTNSLDAKSIINPLGSYGSELSSTSIFNELGRYGSELSSLSPSNPLASKPPMIYKDGEFIAYLTVNTIKTPRVDPYALIGWLKVNE